MTETEQLVCGCAHPNSEHENDGRGLGDTSCRACEPCQAFAVNLAASTVAPAPA